jgi:hypothetical protein
MDSDQEQLAAFEEAKQFMDKVHNLAFMALPFTFIFNKKLMVEFRDYCKIFSDAKAAKDQNETED